MKNLIANYENLIKKFNNDIKNNEIQNYDNKLLKFIKEVDDLLILNNFIWLPNEIANSNITSKELRLLFNNFIDFTEICTKKMSLFIDKKPKNKHYDDAFDQIHKILQFYINKINKNQWFENSTIEVQEYEKHELKSLNLYLFSSLDLLTNIIYKNHKNYNLNVEKQIKFKNHILKYSKWIFKNYKKNEFFYKNLWKSEFWKIIKNNRNEIAHNYRPYYNYATLRLSNCLYILICRLYLEIDLELRNNSKIWFKK